MALTISATRGEGQIYVVRLGDGLTPDSGAQLIASTSIGQKTYKIKCGTGGILIPQSEVPDTYWDGRKADIPLDIIVYASGSDTRIATYKVVIHRTYLRAESQGEDYTGPDLPEDLPGDVPQP